MLSGIGAKKLGALINFGTLVKVGALQDIGALLDIGAKLGALSDTGALIVGIETPIADIDTLCLSSDEYSKSNDAVRARLARPGERIVLSSSFSSGESVSTYRR